MKILYLADQDLDNQSGVSQKISMQSQQWIKEGHEVVILSLMSLSFFSVNKERLTPAIVTMQRAGYKIFIHLLLVSWKIGMILKNLEFDIVYMRYRLYSPFFKKSLKNHPQVVEINTDDINEFKHSSVLLALYNKTFRGLFLRNTDGFICVSNELEILFNKFNKSTRVIANGINTNSFTLNESKKNSRPSLVFIGSPNQQWHGVEKIVFMADNLSEFDFHIIGWDGKNSKNLFYHGYLPTGEANKIVQKYDIGISTLSLYKKKMEEASPLKARQYLAQGLPIIYAYEDTDFIKDNKFSLQLENTEDNVANAIEDIRKFVNLVYNNTYIQQASRNFATQYLDTSKKEKSRVEFFGKFI